MIRMELGKMASIACLVLIVAALVAGCGGGGGGGVGDSTAPTITGVDVTDAQSYAAQDVTITADVSDAGGLKSVVAIITKPDSTQTAPITMTYVSGNTYTGIYRVAENDTPIVQTYSCVIRATDNSNNEATSNPVTFIVPREGPPPPPAG